MAPQTKKPAKRRRPAAKKTARNKKSFSGIFLKTFVGLFLLLCVGMAGYVFGYKSGKSEHADALHAQKQRNAELNDALKEARRQTASHEYEKVLPQPPKRDKEPTVPPGGIQEEKPMLAIIFDDVSFAHDVKNIKALNLPVTMSFLPPSKRHPDSAKLAAEEPFYMVHFPLEAVSFSGEEPDTLHVGDSEERMDERVRQIKALFPKVQFVNNHTGSKFTADKASMEKLIYALDREGMTFVDSRTTSETAVPALMQSLHRPYISRDVFLDHDPDVEEVKKEVRRAVKIAKKYGYAVAIGHPHKKTLRGVAESKDVLSQVDLVQIDTLVAHMKK